jgi:hypothetical protein
LDGKLDLTSAGRQAVEASLVWLEEDGRKLAEAFGNFPNILRKRKFPPVVTFVDTKAPFPSETYGKPRDARQHKSVLSEVGFRSQSAAYSPYCDTILIGMENGEPLAFETAEYKGVGQFVFFEHAFHEEASHAFFSNLPEYFVTPEMARGSKAGTYGNLLEKMYTVPKCPGLTLSPNEFMAVLGVDCLQPGMLHLFGAKQNLMDEIVAGNLQPGYRTTRRLEDFAVHIPQRALVKHLEKSGKGTKEFLAENPGLFSGTLHKTSRRIVEKYTLPVEY